MACMFVLSKLEAFSLKVCCTITLVDSGLSLHASRNSLYSFRTSFCSPLLVMSSNTRSLLVVRRFMGWLTNLGLLHHTNCLQNCLSKC